MNQPPVLCWGSDAYPLYIRKLDKKSRWGHSSDEIKSRSDRAAAAIFPSSDEAYSLYLVESDEDLRRVVVALNLRRGHPNEQVDLIAFQASEFQEVGIEVLDDNDGETGCLAANKLHVDIRADDHASFQKLCLTAMERQLEACRVSKSEATKMVVKQLEYGCEAFPENDACPCHSA